MTKGGLLAYRGCVISVITYLISGILVIYLHSNTNELLNSIYIFNILIFKNFAILGAGQVQSVTNHVENAYHVIEGGGLSMS